MKERLGAADWLAVVANSGAGSLAVAAGRVVQLIAAGIVLLASWPTLGAVVAWLRTGGWSVPTPMSLAPEAARRAATSTDWVIFQDVLAWLAVHHVLWTALPAAILVGLLGTGIVALGQRQRGRASDIVSTSLRDEYRVRQAWARWRPRLVFAILAAVVLGVVAAAILY